ncbi:MAG TPA: bifunctional nicotinamidase/pyrazinamidase [Enterovirga sp.]|jgi:nicotinamidase/pyrazinamidase
MSITLRDTDVLLAVDVQNDFLPGGRLAVPDGDAVVPVINRLAPMFHNVVLTQDWHTEGHASFASAHRARRPFDIVELSYGRQVLWPDHCVRGTPGADFAPGLTIPQAQLVIRKGYHPSVDSYSAFVEADGATCTGLAGYLRERGIKRVFLAGLATDYCVAFSALDAVAAGFEALVIEDACRGIDLAGSLAAAWARMDRAGVRRTSTEEIG